LLVFDKRKIYSDWSNLVLVTTIIGRMGMNFRRNFVLSGRPVWQGVTGIWSDQIARMHSSFRLIWEMVRLSNPMRRIRGWCEPGTLAYYRYSILKLISRFLDNCESKHYMNRMYPERSIQCRNRACSRVDMWDYYRGEGDYTSRIKADYEKYYFEETVGNTAGYGAGKNVLCGWEFLYSGCYASCIRTS
jgi:hypothetical protein